jgi:hypothetical protein
MMRQLALQTMKSSASGRDRMQQQQTLLTLQLYLLQMSQQAAAALLSGLHSLLLHVRSWLEERELSLLAVLLHLVVAAGLA